MNYDTLRHFADSYGLIFLGILFVGLIGWTFRKGARSANARAANSIFERDEQDG